MWKDSLSVALHNCPVFCTQIINEDVAKKMCEEHQLCVVAVLPHILDTGEHRLVLAAGCSECFLSEMILFHLQCLLSVNQGPQAGTLTWKFF